MLFLPNYSLGDLDKQISEVWKQFLFFDVMVTNSALEATKKQISI